MNLLESITSRLNVAESRVDHVLNTIKTVVGVWDWDMETDILIWDSNMFELFGVSKPNDSGVVSYAFFERCLHPSDVGLVSQAVANSINDHTHYEYVFQLSTRPGVFILGTGKCFYSESGTPQRFLGICLQMPKNLRL